MGPHTPHAKLNYPAAFSTLFNHKWGPWADDEPVIKQDFLFSWRFPHFEVFFDYIVGSTFGEKKCFFLEREWEEHWSWDNPCSCGHTILDGASLAGKRFPGVSCSCRGEGSEEKRILKCSWSVLQEDARSTCIWKVLQINSFAPSAEYFDLGSKNRKSQPATRTESSPCRARRVFWSGIILEVKLGQTRRMEIWNIERAFLQHNNFVKCLSVYRIKADLQVNPSTNGCV